MNDNLKSVYRLFDAALIIGFITGIFYACGFVYFKYFYRHFRIDLVWLDFSPQIYIAYGAASLVQISILLLIALILYVLWSKASEKWKDTKVIRALSFKMKSLKELPFLYRTTIFVLIANTFAALLVVYNLTRGVESAQDFSEKYAPIAQIRMKGASTTVEYGIVTINNGKYYFFELNKNGRQSPKVHVVDEREIESIVIVGRVNAKH